MKKLLSFTFAILLTALTIGCTANTQTPNETATNTEVEVPKGTYNVAYITVCFLTEKDKIKAEYDPSIFNKINDADSGTFNGYSIDYSYYCRITDWEYGKNDTVILYLKDGRTIQTSFNNVMLMYDPDF